MGETQRFYDELAEDYHLVYGDWDASVRGQGELLSHLIGRPSARVLDVACGMGTQAIGLALSGHEVVGHDLSSALVERARAEALRLGAELTLDVADMRRPPDETGAFDVVLAFDNALPHLESEAELEAALRSARDALTSGGLFLASTRDYDQALKDRPRFDPPRVIGAGPTERIVLQLWTWLDERSYELELMILTRDAERGWQPRVRKGRYRAIRRHELTRIAETSGLVEATWLEPAESGFYQPILRARRP